MKNSGLPSATINNLDALRLEYLVIYDDLYCEIFEVHFLGKANDRNLCWQFNPHFNANTATGDYEQQTFKWIMEMVDEGRFIIFEGDPEEIQNQIYRKDVLGSLQNKWAPRPH